MVALIGASVGRATRRVCSGLMALLVLVGCAGAQEQTDEARSVTSDAGLNVLTDAERAAGWALLFDGHSLDGWRFYDRDETPEGWAARDGLLVRVGSGGDIITDREFTDFELTLEWRVGEAGNSGVFYRAAKGEERIYHSAPEMQILDDAGHLDGQSPLTSAGSNYGLHAVPRGVVHAAGAWNRSRVVVEGTHVEHWLNGTRVVEYDFGSPEWEGLVADSKFAAWPAYGRAARGHIGLQDHGDIVWYRNIKIREIGR